ncbi:Tll0287-like domain-containing protein [Thiocystis violacea]|uniref:Tll0287-like domain-containing protein n=1 Tax=Thiocystis violacea TaxID=13725 RepID=UPI0019053796|nr:DUF3365 domain-containing protein [Thiocystis violacea]MBK1717521.1 glutamate synthase [Thiocystis violacea]
MKVLTRPTLAAACALLIAGLAHADDKAANPNVDEAKGLIKQFADQLQSELKTSINNGGPIKAIEVCQKRAPAIAAGLSRSSGWEVGRTSLKPRNAKLGAPDDWERGVLESFETRKASGESVETMAHAEVVETDQGQRFRFMKAVPTQEVCLACHGTEISEPVAAALDERYPQDQARGFALGDIRGAFSLSKPL